MKLLRWLIPLLLIASPAIAQWQVPNYAVPIGRGVGVTGFKSAAPGGAGQPLVSNGATSDPSFSTKFGIMPDGLSGCVRDGTTDCTAGVVAAAAAANAAGVPLRLGYPNGYCITPIQFGGSSPPVGVSLASLPYGIVADSPKSAFVSCSSSPTSNAMVTITNWAAGTTIVPGFTMGPMIISAGANNSYALQVYGSIYSNLTATLRGGSVATLYVRADSTHVVINNTWNFSYDTQTAGISALMQTTDGAANGIAIAANDCTLLNPFGTVAGDVVQTDYMNGGCRVDAESSGNGYGVNLGHQSSGDWYVHTEGNFSGGVNGTANTKGARIYGSSQDGVTATLKACITCVVDVWNNISGAQERNYGDAVGQSVYVKGLPATLPPPAGQGWMGSGPTNGAAIAGNGSTNDVVLLNAATASVGWALPHNIAVMDCVTGFRIGGAAASNAVLVGNGTNFVSFATGTGVTTFWATPSSANLRAALTDETGTGAAYFQGGDLGTPSAGVLTNATGTAAGLTAGTATNAVNSGITNDTTTNATMFPVWVTANTGNLPLKVTSTKLSFNPSTGNLSITQATIANGSSTQGLTFLNGSAAADAVIYEGSGGALGIKTGTANTLNITKNDNSSVIDYAVTTASTLTLTPATNTLAETTIRSGTATPAGGSTSARLLFGTTAGFGIYYGSGAPTVSAAKGSLYLRSDGSGTTDRIYVNTNGSTTWTNLTSGA